MKVYELKAAIEGSKQRSAWSKGVAIYAYELLEQLPDDYDFAGSVEDSKKLLNGADSWSQYSWGGCSLIYDEDIAERLCTPSELKRNKNGQNRPNQNEDWLDVQTRALNQARRLITRTLQENQ